MKTWAIGKFRRQSKYGTHKWNPVFLLMLAVIINLTVSIVLGVPLFILEDGNPVINSYDDAVWLLWMSASTIGFGDTYPTTGIGRIIVGLITIPGAAMIGAAVRVASDMAFGWSDSSVSNDELRALIHAQTKKLKEITKDIERSKQALERLSK